MTHDASHAKIRFPLHILDACGCSAADCEDPEDNGRYIEPKDEQDADSDGNQEHFKHLKKK